MVALLAPGAVGRVAGGGRVPSRRIARGSLSVAGALVNFAPRPPRRLGIAAVNGAPGLVLRDADGVLTVISFTVDGGRVTALDVVRNPDKLSGVREPG